MEKVKGNIGVVISDGVGYRNFIYSNFLPKAIVQFEKIVIFTYLPLDCYKEIKSTNLEIVECNVIPERFVSWILRKIKEIAHLKKNSRNNFGIKDNYLSNYPKNWAIRSLITRLIFLFTNFLYWEWFIQWIERLQMLTIKNITSKDLLSKIKQLDYVFFSHQRPPFALPILKLAKRFKKKTGAFIFSWDNLPSKGRMMGNFNDYYVWSDLMKGDLSEFYPNVSTNNVFVVGTPQFESYVMPDFFISNEEFRNRLGIPGEKKIITFSCGDITTSKNDELYIEIIANAVDKRLFGENFILLVRTSPAESADRFNKLKSNFKNIIWNVPDWNLVRDNHPEPWSQRLPSKNDIEILRAILTYSEIGVNMCSTMSLDFMLFDKPVINPVFGNTGNHLYDDQRFLNYRHYDVVVKSGAVGIAKNEIELIHQITNSIQSPAARLNEQKKLINLEIGIDLPIISETLIKTLKERISENNNN
jgi:hypothetical protein